VARDAPLPLHGHDANTQTTAAMTAAVLLAKFGYMNYF